MLTAIVVVSTTVRIILSRNAPGPWIFVDEIIYSELARSAFGGMGIRGLPVSGYGSVYPFLIAPSYALFQNLLDAYAAVKATNALVMSLTAVPVYFIARTLMSRPWALTAAALAILVPAMAYTGVVMTESAFYPAFALAMLMVLLALTKPTVLRQLAVFAAAVLCFEVRPQGVVVVPAFVVSAVLLILLDCQAADSGSRARELGRGLLRFLPTWLLVVGGSITLIAIQTSRGQSLGSLLGAYSTTTEMQDRYQIRPIITWFVLHIAELDLWLGILPVLALLVLIGRALCRTDERPLRVFVAAAVPVMLLMTLLVSAFVVFANVGRIEERNLFYVGLFALIALCWWASVGLKRQPRWFSIALVGVCMAPVALPYIALINATAVSDTFGLYLPWAIQNRLQEGMLTSFAVIVGGLAMAMVAVLVRPRFAVVPVIAVVAFFLVSSAAVDLRTDKASAGALAQGISGSRDWIDVAVGSHAEVAVLYPGTLEPLRVWQNEFFNRSVGPVYAIGVPLPGGLPETVVNVAADGSVLNRPGFRIEADFVLVDSSTKVVGQTVAADTGAGMSVVRVAKPLRLLEVTTGIYSDGWTGSDVIYTRYGCVGGTVSVGVRLDAYLHSGPVTVTPSVADTPEAAVVVTPDGKAATITSILIPEQGVCQVHYVVSPTAVPAGVSGNTDPRALGVLMGEFSYTPPT